MLRIRGKFLALAVFIFAVIILAGYARQAEAVRPYSDIKVILYMIDWCPYCMQAREYIQSLGVQLIEYNIELDKEKEWESIEKSGRRGVPVIDVEGIVIHGYVPEVIRGAVEMKRNQ
jgi:glutaredoxin